MIVRYVPWGAWVRLETFPSVVAIDRAAARDLGLNGAETWAGCDSAVDANSVGRDFSTGPIEVHLAVTSRCGAGCRGCYLDAKPDGIEPLREALAERMDALRDAGALTVAFGGGEPTTRRDLGHLAQDARARGLEPVVTTSGIGMSAEKIEQLEAFAQVNVSYDGDADGYASVRGFNGAAAAERAIAMLVLAGVRVGVNVVLTKATFSSLRATLERARALGAKEAQLLRYKPGGRATGLDYLAQRLAPEQAASLGPLLRDLALEFARATPNGALLPFPIRVDCALVPFLSADQSLAGDPNSFARFGVFGCEAGGALAAVRVDGQIVPCSFAQPVGLDAGDLAAQYPVNANLEEWRTSSKCAAEPCASCTLRHVCKGGCKIVAQHLTGERGPDPECPRVIAYAQRRTGEIEPDA